MDPVIFKVCDSIAVHGFGLMVAIALSVSFWLTYTHPLRKKIICGDALLNVLFALVVFGVLGGKLLFALVEWDGPWYVPLNPFVEGSSVIGSIAAIVVTVLVSSWVYKFKVADIMDYISSYASLAQAIARIGCLWAGCCHGAVVANAAWWTVTYAHPDSLATTGVPLHPAQLYASFASLIIFLAIWLFFKKTWKFPGMTMSLYFFLEGVARFAVDFWRSSHDLAPHLFSFKIGGTVINIVWYQALALCIAAIGLIGFVLTLVRGHNVNREEIYMTRRLSDAF
jgi:phosphatidylglycerol---prolipoprotein diacylglyceryl transferase